MLNFRDYLDYAKRYLALAEDEKLPDANWLLIPATILAWSAIELFVNNRFSDLASLPEGMFSLHEKAFLLEQKLRFVDSGSQLGQFVLEGNEYRSLDDKIFFLIAKFSPMEGRNIKGETLWQRFEDFKNTRDSLVHPRQDTEVIISVEDVRRYIETAKSIIQLVSQHVWDNEIIF